MKTSSIEKNYFNITKSCNIHLKRAIIIFMLFIASGLMVSGWILHLKFSYYFWIAFLISMAFTTIEYIINTSFTRYSQFFDNVFEPYQLACISLIGGIIFTFIIGFTAFNNKLHWTDGLGILFFIASSFLLLWDKKTL